ncbi:hypothetical protein [Spirillospora sp. CA-128828]|uniref:hypothetical protein n=1 Tax=Spirillospora sp. CA-128828 TaxID=3240033 RepID=UPI003D8CFF3F
MDAALEARASDPGSAEHAQLLSNARHAVRSALRVIDVDVHRRGPTASHVSAAQMHVNSARTLWWKTLPPEDLAPHLPDLFAIIKQHLPANDTRRIAAEDVARNMQQAQLASHAAQAADGRRHRWIGARASGHATPSSEAMSTVLDAVDAAREASMKEKLRAANFARLVRWVTALLFGLAIAIAVLGAIWKSAVPLCFTLANGSRQEFGVVCPSRSVSLPSGASAGQMAGRTASPGDYVIVEIAGMTAACIAAAAALRKVRGTSTAFGIPVALALLKLPTGAIVAVLGIILLRGEFIPGLSALDTSGQIIAWAVVLGYSQELFTNFVDRQGREVLDGVHGTADPKAAREIANAEATATASAPLPVPVPSGDGEGRPANTKN